MLFKIPIRRYLKLLAESRVIQILTAGRKDQPVIEEAGHGVFTRTLLDGLKGHADTNADGLITGNELGAWMHPRVAQASNYLQDTQFGNLEGEGQIVFMLLQGGGQPASETQVAVGVYASEQPSTSAWPKTLTNSIGMAFVLIPAGEFRMGSDASNADDDEHPEHRVRISQPFYLGSYEVTQAQWKAVMGSNPSWFKGASWPVENVSWKQVQVFIRELKGREGHTKYRLPTEAEWEYAARAGTTTTYSFGDAPTQLNEYAWYGGNSGRTTHPVGQRRPNPWELYDMHGNVWEWVQDWYDEDYYARSPGIDPQGPSAGIHRAMRGGSWNYDGSYCRSAVRRHAEPGLRNTTLGFRLLRTMP